ncbi:MAG: hypothetical protein ACOVRM_07120, partial [Planctomycetaceae bacterium]
GESLFIRETTAQGLALRREKQTAGAGTLNRFRTGTIRSLIENPEKSPQSIQFSMRRKKQRGKVPSKLLAFLTALSVFVGVVWLCPQLLSSGICLTPRT